MIKIAKSELGRLIAENRQQQHRHLIVADGVYEQFIEQKKDNELDCIEGTNQWGGNECKGGCENPRFVCDGYYESDPDTGEVIFWCMCDPKDQRKELFTQGLKKAQELLTPDEFKLYKKDIMDELSIKE